MEAEMGNSVFGQLTLKKWIVLAVVLAAIGFTLLVNFTSFQIPRGITQGTVEPTVHPGIQVDGTTTSRTNLDEAYDIIHGSGADTNSRESGDGN